MYTQKAQTSSGNNSSKGCATKGSIERKGGKANKKSVKKL